MELCILISGSSERHHRSMDRVSVPSFITKCYGGFVLVCHNLLLLNVLLCLLVCKYTVSLFFHHLLPALYMLVW